MRLEFVSATKHVACVLLLTQVFAACVSAPPEPQTPPPAVQDETPVAAPEPEAPIPPPVVLPKPPDLSHLRLSISAVGDMMLGTDYPENRLPDDDAVGFLQAVTPYLEATDLTFGNLEGVLTDGGKPAKQCSNPNACYLFRSPTRYARYFRDAGFDGLSVANNHARDFGEDGRSDTMAALREFGIAHSGREGDFATLQVGGLRVSFIAFAVTRNSNLLHDYELAATIVAEQARDHDIVVVSFHGGAEGAGSERTPFAEEFYYGEPRGNVVRFARLMIDSGADFVFGHGPHVVRGMERYRDRLIAYSLGNFATYYGISVAGDRGVAPILAVELDGNGRFLRGQIHSTKQIRPAGPTLDPDERAAQLLAALTAEDFADAGLEFGPGGRLTPRPRQPAGLPRTPSSSSSGARQEGARR